MTERPLMDEDRWVTPMEAARYLSVTTGTLAKWRQQGIGPRYSAALGRDPRYRMSHLSAFMDCKMAGNTREALTLRRSSTKASSPAMYNSTSLAGGL